VQRRRVQQRLGAQFGRQVAAREQRPQVGLGGIERVLRLLHAGAQQHHLGRCIGAPPPGRERRLGRAKLPRVAVHAGALQCGAGRGDGQRQLGRVACQRRTALAFRGVDAVGQALHGLGIVLRHEGLGRGGQRQRQQQHEGELHNDCGSSVSLMAMSTDGSVSASDVSSSAFWPLR